MSLQIELSFSDILEILIRDGWSIHPNIIPQNGFIISKGDFCWSLGAHDMRPIHLIDMLMARADRTEAKGNSGSGECSGTTNGSS